MSSSAPESACPVPAPTQSQLILRRVLLSEPYAFPAPEMDLARSAGPVVEVWPNTYAVLDFALSRAIMRDPRFRVEDTSVFAQRFPTWSEHAAARSFLHELLSLNGEAHHRLREVMSSAFVPPASERMLRIVAETVTEVAAPLSHQLGRGEVVDLSQLCSDVPLLAINRLLGLPDELAAPMAAWTDTFSDVLRSNFLSRPRLRAGDQAVREMQQALRPYVRPGAVPADSLVATLVDAHAPLADVIGSDDEGLLANIILLYSAGLDTTRTLLRAMLSTVARDRTLVPLLSVEPQAATRFIREMERLHPPIELTSRYAEQPIELAGAEFPAGSHVFVMIDAANRDPDMVGAGDPHTWSVAGRARRSISFGGGARTCLGLPMARAMAEAVLAETLTWPPFEATDADLPRTGLTVWTSSHDRPGGDQRPKPRRGGEHGSNPRAAATAGRADRR